MKTVRLLLCSLVCLIVPSYGALYLTYEEDLRGYYNPSNSDIKGDLKGDISGEIKALTGSVRQVFSDKKGDRLILYGQVEIEENFSMYMLHQLYARYKGPMGKWNITLGRVLLPWGLRTSWSPERLPYSSPYKLTKILTADNGVMISGTVGVLEYGLAVTQGYGMGEIHDFPGEGLATGRIAISPLISGDLTVGLSGSAGTSYRSTMGHGHHAQPVEHISGALDLTAFIGRGTVRLEAGADKTERFLEKRGFLELEHQLLPKLSLLAAGNVYSVHEEWQGTLYGGVSTKLKSVTIRGGYEYAYKKNTQKITLQLYRQFSFNR